MEYKLGQTYELQTNGIFTDSKGYNYISLIGLDENEYRVYNIMKCQQESLPPKIYVKVRQIDAFGKVKLIQDEQRVLQEHYQKETLYPFSITSSERDSKGKHYYIIEDDFAAQRYYTEDEKYSVGDDVTLELHHTDDKGYLCFREVEHPDLTPQPQVAYTAPNDHDGHYYVKYGPEGKKLEYKSSIAFLPGVSVPDIDKQMLNIIKAITAMMNAEGGKLVIGVNDKDQEIMGIKQDFAHLNDGEYDKYAGSYNSNHDGYKLKIMNELRRISGSYAGSLIEKMDIKSKGGKEYCVIDILPADRPIWMSGNKLYQRQENSSEQLFGDNLTHFIVQRMLNNSQLIDTQTIDTVMRQRFNPSHTATPSAPRVDEIAYWLVWDNDANWRKSKIEPANNVAFRVAIPCNKTDMRLVFCYPSGRINVVMEKDFRKNDKGKRGWSTEETPMCILTAEPSDLLVGYSIDYNDCYHVKVHAITDYNSTQSATNQGKGRFLPNEGHNPTRYHIIPGYHRNRISHLVMTSAQRANTCGEPVNGSVYQKEIAYLQQLLPQE